MYTNQRCLICFNIVQVWLIFIPLAPVCCTKTSRPQMCLLMKILSQKLQMQESGIFLEDLMQRVHLLKWKLMRFFLPQSTLYCFYIFILQILKSTTVWQWYHVTGIFFSSRVKEFRQFSEKSDMYSFGVFLLELVCGQEARESYSPDSNQTLVERVRIFIYNYSWLPED